MRNQFAATITELATRDSNIALLYADIGNRLFNNLKDVAPERTINAGIAEANMATMAAGMAMDGFKPVIYTITPFTTARNFEQIKVDIAYQNQPVVIVGTGSGMSYANLGPTHHSFEDLALMRVLPNMQVVCPCDKVELAGLLPMVIESGKPTYLRIGKKNEPVIYETPPDLQIGKIHPVREGAKVMLLVNGIIMPEALKASEILTESGISTAVSSAHTLKPLDEEYLKHAFETYELVVTIEEHSLIGGFGSAVAEWLIDNEIHANLLRIGLADKFIDKLGSQSSARKRAGIDAEGIVRQVTARFG